MTEESASPSGGGHLALVEDDPLAAAVDDPAETANPELPLPPDIKTIFLGGLFLLALLAAFYAAAEIVLPVVVAVVLMLVLQPAMRLLRRLRLPRPLAALLMIAVLFAALAGLSTVLSGPAASWAQKLPEGIPKLEQR